MSSITILAVLVLVLLIGWIGLTIIFPVKHSDKKEPDIMSFKASQELVGLPIITFYSNKHKLHFLLDTGADRSLFNTKTLPLVEHSIYENASSSFTAADGTTVQVGVGHIKLYYEGKEYENDFNLGDLSAISQAIGLVVKGKPIEIVGVIGDDFLAKYRYILDFEKMIAYSKV